MYRLRAQECNPADGGVSSGGPADLSERVAGAGSMKAVAKKVSCVEVVPYLAHARHPAVHSEALCVRHKRFTARPAIDVPISGQHRLDSGGSA